MDLHYRLRNAVITLFLFYVSLSTHASTVSAENISLVVGEYTTLHLSPSLQVKNSPGLKPGATVVCERVHIQGLSRLRNLDKYAHSVKLKVLYNDTIIRRANVEVCFHRNTSLGIGMCPQGQWEKVSKGSWVRFMSPFYHKLLDIRASGLSSDALEISMEEEFFSYRIIFLIFGAVLWSLASPLSKSLAFFYCGAMGVGIILVIIVILFQGMKLLPTGRKSSLAVFLYSSVVGLGTFVLRYIPGLLRLVLEELGISEDMYNPLAIFLVAFLVLGGAWLGFWVVRKFVLTEDGSIDVSTSTFVAWSIRIFAAIMIIQSSMDPLLAGEALISAILVSSTLRRITRLKFLRRLFKKLFKFIKKSYNEVHVPDLSPIKDSIDEYALHKKYGDSNFISPQSKHTNRYPWASSTGRHHWASSTDRYPMASASPPVQGISRKSPSQLSDSDTFPSTFHRTPERRKLTKEELDRFTRDSTKKAIKELVSSPDFGKWAAANADRINVTPLSGSTSKSSQRRRWFLWS